MIRSRIQFVAEFVRILVCGEFVAKFERILVQVWQNSHEFCYGERPGESGKNLHEFCYGEAWHIWPNSIRSRIRENSGLWRIRSEV